MGLYDEALHNNGYVCLFRGSGVIQITGLVLMSCALSSMLPVITLVWADFISHSMLEHRSFPSTIFLNHLFEDVSLFFQDVLS